MALRVAPCPRCRSALVFGERRCRSCGQSFDYGATAPAEPTPEQVHDALVAAGMLRVADAAPAPAGPPPAVAPPAVPPSTAAAAVLVAPMPGLDTGRYEATGDVPVQDIPGFIDSSLFAAFTPKNVDVMPLAQLERTSNDGVGDVAPVVTPGLERTRQDVDAAVPLMPLVAIEHTALVAAAVPVPVVPVPELEASLRARRAGEPAPRVLARGELAAVICRSCGHRHAHQRCPQCGTARLEK